MSKPRRNLQVIPPGDVIDLSDSFEESRLPEDAVMQAVTVRDRDAGVSGLSVMDMPYPHAAQNDVIVRVHAAGFTPGELDWSGTWTDRAGRDRTPSVPGHELSGVVVELGYGTTGLTVGQRVFGLTDWTRNGSLAEYSRGGGPQPRSPSG